MVAYILMTCAWLVAMITVCFTFWQWGKCRDRCVTLSLKCERLQRRCVMLSDAIDERGNTIRKLRERLALHRSTH